MFERKVVKKATRLVWRMSATNPAGEFVSPFGRRADNPGPADIHDRGFRASSLDLSNGAGVVEAELSTWPRELLDEIPKDER